ncbi:MAG: Flp family type IVb pilin [Anaerolineae bacterium]
MTAIIGKFWHDESGPEMVEWAVVALVLLAFTVAGILAIRDSLIDMFQAAFTKLEAVPPSTFP